MLQRSGSDAKLSSLLDSVTWLGVVSASTEGGGPLDLLHSYHAIIFCSLTSNPVCQCSPALSPFLHMAALSAPARPLTSSTCMLCRVHLSPSCQLCAATPAVHSPLPRQLLQACRHRACISPHLSEPKLQLASTLQVLQQGRGMVRCTALAALQVCLCGWLCFNNTTLLQAAAVDICSKLCCHDA
jgi:hypothetical protein